MFGDNTTSSTGNQQPGDNTPPPMLDTPISNASPSDPPSAPALDPPAGPAPMDFSTGAPVPSADSPIAPLDAAQASDSTPSSSADSDIMGSPDGTDDLLHIKQQALQQLTPLVDHLDQSPKEEFRTTMMMIQATDNQELVKKAFDAAQKIEDDKERAQAFLDIINEINYFTQHNSQEQ